MCQNCFEYAKKIKKLKKLLTNEKRGAILRSKKGQRKSKSKNKDIDREVTKYESE